MIEYDRTGKAPAMERGSGTIVNKTTKRYMRPFNFNVPVTPFGTAGAVCLSPNRQPRACQEFLVQADLANGSYVSVGFQGTNLVNGLQLLAGQGWVFSISGFNDLSRVVATPTSWVQGLEQARQTLLGAQNTDQELLLNISDFWVAGNGAKNQNIIVFYFMVPKVNS